MNIFSLIIGVLAGLLISSLGVFVINRRLALAADAFSHVALPGVAVAILLGSNPILGALIALLCGTLIIHFIQVKTKLFPEILIGVIFSLSLAVGLLLLPEGDLESALLGDLATINFQDFILGIILSLLLLVILLVYFRRFTFVTFSETLAQVSGAKVNHINLVLLLALTLAVALGLKVAGTLLVGSLLIVPPATAQLGAKNFKTLFIASAFYGVAAVVGGAVASGLLNFPPGPLIILFEGLFFLSNFALFKKVKLFAASRQAS